MPAPLNLCASLSHCAFLMGFALLSPSYGAAMICTLASRPAHSPLS